MHSLKEKNQYIWLMVTWPWLDIGLSICVCARLCVLFTCQIGIFLKKRSCTMRLKLIRPHDIGQQQSLNNRWANHFTSAERRWWGRVILALVWSVCSAAPVFRRYNYTHTCPHVAVSLFFLCLFGVWSVLALPHHRTFTHIFSTYLQPCVCPEGTVSQRKHAGCMYFIFLYLCYFRSHAREHSTYCVLNLAKLPFDICALLGISCSSDHLTSDQEQLFSFRPSDTWCPTLMPSCVACC